MRLSLAVTAVATTRTQTSPLLGRGSSTSRTLRTSGGPYEVQTTALTPPHTRQSYAQPVYFGRSLTLPRMREDLGLFCYFGGGQRFSSPVFLDHVRTSSG